MKSYALHLLSALALLAALAASTGCTHTTYTDPSGAKFSRTSFLNSQSAAKVEYKSADKTLTIDGYTSDQAQIAGAVVGAAVRAAVIAK